MVEFPDYPCSRCARIFHHPDALRSHESTCSSHSLQSHSFVSPGLSPNRHPVPMMNGQYDYALRPVRSIESFSYNTAPMFSCRPESSPAPSVEDHPATYSRIDSRRSSASNTNRQQRRISPLGPGRPRFAARSRSPVASDNEKKFNKKQKEQKSRAQMALVLQCIEDLLQNYLGLELKNQQTAGNGNEAGLEGVKIDNYRTNICLLNYFIHRDAMRAIDEGRLEEWQSEMRAISKTWHGHDDLTSGTFLANPDGSAFDACRHDRSQRACLVHHQADHVKCRKERHARFFRQNFDEYNASARRDSHCKP